MKYAILFLISGNLYPNLSSVQKDMEKLRAMYEIPLQKRDFHQKVGKKRRYQKEVKGSRSKTKLFALEEAFNNF